MLAVQADLDLEIDGQTATLTGTGQRLVLRLSNARMLRTMADVSLPRFAEAGDQARGSAATLLTRVSLTLEIHDARGPLLILGKNAEGKRLTLPGVGTFEDATLGSRTALFRLAFAR